MSLPHELAEGEFALVLDDKQIPDKESVRRVLLCSGKVHYDLLAEKERLQRHDVAILRVEQFYPYPEWSLMNVIGSYSRAKEICWVQEEPQNMGAWKYLRLRLAQTLPFGRAVRCISRPESASPATGSLKAHRKEQAALVASAFE